MIWPTGVNYKGYCITTPLLIITIFLYYFTTCYCTILRMFCILKKLLIHAWFVHVLHVVITLFSLLVLFVFFCNLNTRYAWLCISGCRPNWVEFKGHCYFYGKLKKVSWFEAKVRYSLINISLICINNSKKKNYNTCISLGNIYKSTTKGF